MRELAIIPDGAMLIDDSRIVQVGTRREIERLGSSDDLIVDAGQARRNAGIRGRSHASGLCGQPRRRVRAAH